MCVIHVSLRWHWLLTLRLRLRLRLSEREYGWTTSHVPYINMEWMSRMSFMQTITHLYKGITCGESGPDSPHIPTNIVHVIQGACEPAKRNTLLACQYFNFILIVDIWFVQPVQSINITKNDIFAFSKESSKTMISKFSKQTYKTCSRRRKLKAYHKIV